MSRCQHNQKITKFCITPSCNHSISGGCQYCFKRYHCHIGQTRFIKQAQICELVKYLTSFEDKKIKIRPFKQAIYNYFNIIKGQISTYLDCLSSDLLNRITYPYIKKQGNLNILKKLKQKDYNKLTTEQIIKINEFKDVNNEQKLQKNEILAYINQSKEVYNKIYAINNLYKQFQKQAQQSYLGQTILSVSIFYKKITEIYQNIQHQKPNYIKKFGQLINENCNIEELKNQKKQGQTILKKKSLNQKKNNVLVTKQNQKQKNVESAPQDSNIQIKKQKSTQWQGQRQNRPRKVSIDSRCTDFLVKSRLRTFQQKQKQITERKLKLQQIINKSSQIYSQNKKRQSSSSSNSSQNRKKFIQENLNSLNVKSVTDSQRNKEGLVQRDNFAHTLLPQGKQQRKLYQQQIAVEKKTLKVPVNVIQQNAEDQQCQSPILRLKKSQKQKAGGSTGFQLGLFKVQASTEQQTHSQNIQKATQAQSKSSSEASDKQNIKPSLPQPENLSISQKQANSLFLLVQSLKLNAKKAITLLEASLKYAPHNFSAAEYLSFLYLQQNKPKQCLKVCNQTLSLIQSQPNSVQISYHLYNNKAAALNQLGRFSQSISLLQKCIQTKKKDILYKNLADAYFSLGIVEKALVNYQNATVLNDQNHQAMYNLAVCLFLQKNYDTAKLKVQRALMIDRNNENYIQLYKQINKMITGQTK